MTLLKWQEGRYQSLHHRGGQQQLTSGEKSPWCRRSKVSPDLVEYGTSWSPRCRAITVTWSGNLVLELRVQSQYPSALCAY